MDTLLLALRAFGLFCLRKSHEVQKACEINLCGDDFTRVWITSI